MSDFWAGTEVESTMYTSPSYTAKQIARVLYDDINTNPTMSTKEIASVIRVKGIYRLKPSTRHYRVVRDDLISKLLKTGEV